MMLFRNAHCITLSRGRFSTSRHRPSRLAATLMLAVIVAAPLASQQAAAHGYWPTKPKVELVVKSQRYKFCHTNQYQVKVTVRLENAPPASSFWEGSVARTVGLNWCMAKDNLPAGWDTQDDRHLRTNSMCAEKPAFSSLGKDILWDDPATNQDHVWESPKWYNFEKTKWIFSINYWTPFAHHAGGNHTGLFYFEFAPQCKAGQLK